MENNQKQIADEIFAQLGGNKFIVMTDAKNFCSGQKEEYIFLSFKLSKKHNGINYVKISLTLSDHYNMEFGCIKGRCKGYEVVETISGITVDDLQSTFTEKTGLDTYL